MRDKSINGKYVDVVCYCTFDKHPGALNRHLLCKKHCIAKKCPYMQIVDDREYRQMQSIKDRRRLKMSEKIKIKYFNDEIEKIAKITAGDWIDLRAAKDIELTFGEYALIPLGVAMELPVGYEALVAPRSSTYKHFGIIQANSLGVIDESYKGDNDQWHFPAICLKTDTMSDGRMVAVIHKGDRICQFRIIKHQPDIEFETVEHLGNVSRGGIGSTGKN